MQLSGGTKMYQFLREYIEKKVFNIKNPFQIFRMDQLLSEVISSGQGKE